MNGIITQTRVGRLFVDQVAARYYDCYFSVPRDKATGEFFATTDGTLAATWYTDVNAQAVARCGGSLRINLTDVTDDEGVMCYDAAGAYLGFVALPTADAFGYVALPTGTATFRLCLSQGRTYADGVKTADGATFQYRAPTPTTGDELAWMGGEAACAAFGTLSKKRERETGGKYFREKLDGQITIYGEDFRRIATLGVEDYARLRLYRTTEGQQQQTATLFYEWDCMKTSCTLDYVRRTAKIASVETDRYTDFLNAYENEYNAIDLAPEIGQLTMTRRPMVQCYRSGEMVVTNIIDQTFFEEDVTEAVASLKNLTETHHFTFSGSVTVGLTGGVSANADLRDVALTTFRGYYFSYADKQTRAYGRFTGGDYTITLDYRRRDTTSDAVPCVTITVASTGNVYTSYRYGASTSYVSDYVAFSQLLPLAFTATRNIIAKNNEALIGTDGLTLTITDPVGEYYRVLAETDGRDVAGFVRDNQTPNVEGAVTYPRMLLAFSADSGSDTTEDDYFVDTETPYDTIVMMDGGTLDVSTLASSEPTRWGKNTDGDYFLRPSSDQLPVCSSTWTDTSYWWSPSTALQAASATLSHGKTIRHAYPLFSVLQRLVEKIDAGVTFTPDAAHSLFFFAERTKLDVDPIDGVGGLFTLFAVPMTNVTKDDYDTPAKKMQLSVKALLDMLSDAYQCYWYIDDQRRLRIEHLAYFEQGMSYVPDVDEAVDLTALTDRFNGRQALYGQGEVEYSTDDLASRYELSWGDSGAEYFNDYALDVGGRIVKTASKASVSIADFAADVTMMMAYPSSFSDDSVALVTADADGAVTSEIVPMALDGATATTPTAINNYYASWPFLLRLWRRYVYASKAIDIADFFYDARTTTDITRADFRTTTVTLPDMGYELTGRAVKTLVGTGYVVSSQQDLVTGQVTLEINLPPE
jgi:hypothetical protein